MSEAPTHWLSIFLFAIVISGCQTRDPDEPREQMELGVEPPKLLASNRAHKVSLRLRSAPSSLIANDIVTISNLVGRLPGLPRYEIGLITESTQFPGLFDVWASPLVIRMMRSPEWRVIRVDAYSP